MTSPWDAENESSYWRLCNGTEISNDVAHWYFYWPQSTYVLCTPEMSLLTEKTNIHRYANLEHSKRHDGKSVAFVFELCFSGRPKRAKHPCDRTWGHCANDCTLLVVPDRCLVFTIKNTLSVIAVGRQTLLSQSSRRGTEPRRFLFSIA